MRTYGFMEVFIYDSHDWYRLRYLMKLVYKEVGIDINKVRLGICPICGKRYSRKYGVYNHLRVSDCGRTIFMIFNIAVEVFNDMIHHVKRLRNDRWRCEYCFEVFDDVYKLIEHVYYEHLRDKYIKGRIIEIHGEPKRRRRNYYYMK